MAAYELRNPDDVRRLFSALGDQMEHEAGALSVAELDQMALQAVEDDGSMFALGLTLLVAAGAAWSAVRGYQRNDGSVPWGVAWGALGYLFPVPAIVYSAVAQRPLEL